MTRRGNQKAAGVAVVVMLALGITGCGGPAAGPGAAQSPATTSPVAAASASTTEPAVDQTQRFLEEQITAAADALGTRRIERVAEVGCTTNANPEAQAQVTRWEARTSLDVTSDAEANQMARALAKELSSEHWEGELGDLAPAEEPHRTLFQARSADGRFHIDFSQSKGGGENFVGVTIASECQKNLEGHQMVRSPLDPGYGKTDGGKYDVEAEEKALADGTATPAATPTAQPTQKP